MRRSLLLWVILLTGCASVPQASRERDAEAKRYLTHPHAATLYVYRNDFSAGATSEDAVLYVDGRIIGATLPGTYFKIDVRPGDRVLHGQGYDQGMLKVSARTGEITFVTLYMLGGTSLLALISPETGKREIARCCALMENWAPGQRPLFR